LLEMLAIAVGGAIGAMARYGAAHWLGEALGTDFPWGILLVNVSGSLAIGVLFVLLVEQGHLSAVLRSALIVGFLGAFTTFSTFSLQTLALFETGRYLEATLYVLGSVVLSLGAVALGVFLCRQLTGEG
jgi:CrcB protein